MTISRDTQKRREIVFHTLPPAQIQPALALLTQLPGLRASELSPFSVQIEYNIADHCLEDIEALLLAQGFHLEGSLLIRIKRNLAYYCERVQRENLGKPAPRTKNYPAHIEAWAKRPHGDHDETPAEWRQYK
ncbi:MAG: hypothetical protein Q8O79_02430 [Pseudomonadota bacterium]|nr:hypothetical protein [Pseudomonadota bacterium]